MQRNDTGQYMIVLRNASGEAKASAYVTVVCKPTPPRGPLDIGAVNKEGATLSWEVPEDDGGEPLEGK